MDIAVLLGVVQGVTEWLPISSEGAVAAVYSLLRNTSLSEAVAYALWLHLGTAFSALVAFRGQVRDLIKEVTSTPLAPSPLLRFLVVATVISAAIAVPLLLLLDEFSERTGRPGNGYCRCTAALHRGQPSSVDATPASGDWQAFR